MKDIGEKKDTAGIKNSTPPPLESPKAERIPSVKRSESIGTEHKLVKGLDQRADMDGKERWKMMKESEKTMAEWMVRRWNAIQKSTEDEKEQNRLFVDFISAKLKDIPKPTDEQIATACAEYVKDDILVHEAALFVEGVGGALESQGFRINIHEWEKAKKKLSSSMSALELRYGQGGQNSKTHESRVENLLHTFSRLPDRILNRTDDARFKIQYKGSRLVKQSDFDGKKVGELDMLNGNGLSNANDVISPNLLKAMFGQESIHQVSDLEDQTGKIVLARLDYYTSQHVPLNTLDPKILTESKEFRTRVANWHNELNRLTPKERKEKLAVIVKREKDAAEKTAKEAVKKKQEETDHAATKKLVEDLKAVELAKNTPAAIEARKKAAEKEKVAKVESRNRVTSLIQATESLDAVSRASNDLLATLEKITIKIDSTDSSIKAVLEGGNSLEALEESVKKVKSELEEIEAKYLEDKRKKDRTTAATKLKLDAEAKRVNQTNEDIHRKIKRSENQILAYQQAMAGGTEGVPNSTEVVNLLLTRIEAEMKTIGELEESIVSVSNNIQKDYDNAVDSAITRTNTYEDSRAEKLKLIKDNETKIKLINDAIVAAGAAEAVATYRSKQKEITDTTARALVLFAALTDEERKLFKQADGRILEASDKAFENFLNTNTQETEKIQKRIDDAETPESIQKLTTFLEVFYPADAQDAAHKVMEANFKKASAGELASWDNNASFLKTDYTNKSLRYTRTYIGFLQLAFDKSGNTMTAEGKAGDAMRAKYTTLIPEDDFYEIIGIVKPTNQKDDLGKLDGLSQEQCMAVFVQLREVVRKKRDLETPSSEVSYEAKKALYRKGYDVWYAKAKDFDYLGVSDGDDLDVFMQMPMERRQELIDKFNKEVRDASSFLDEKKVELQMIDNSEQDLKNHERDFLVKMKKIERITKYLSKLGSKDNSIKSKLFFVKRLSRIVPEKVQKLWNERVDVVNEYNRLVKELDSENLKLQELENKINQCKSIITYKNDTIIARDNQAKKVAILERKLQIATDLKTLPLLL
ncbi:MAG: hypothetical protein ACOYK6_08865 [Chthoniobacterales bacterium]